ncbi:MAG TPA: flagellar biosynthetic protein FliO [Cellulomonas sp.]
MDSAVLGLRVLLALACVIGLIWVLARRAGWGRGAKRPAGPTVEVVGRQALGRHAGVVVVAVGNRRLLLGYGEQQITMLTELAPVPTVPAETATHAAPVAHAVPVRPVAGTGADVEDLALIGPGARTGPATRTDDAVPEGVVPAGALHGSVLDPSTWSQAVAVLRERTVRR